MGIRLVVVDDNPHLAFGGRVHPANATFQHFVAGLLDLPGSPVDSITSCVPVRPASEPPATLPLDPRIRVVPTVPFDGIAGYLRHLPRLLRANRPLLRTAIADADLLWLKVPASNAALAATLAARAGVPRFVWVAGSARDVAAARFRGPARLGALAIGAGYDALGRLAALGGDRVVVGRGITASLVEDHELRDPAARAWPRDPSVARLAWAGRLVEGKGVEWLLEELVGTPVHRGRRVELALVGNGPARPALEARAAALGIGDRVAFRGYLADRSPYLDALAAGDAFAFPSEAEGFPKVVLDAMAVGLPILARPAGALRPLPGSTVEPLDALGAALDRLEDGPGGWRGAADRSVAFAREHTRRAELERLVAHWTAAGLVAG